MPIRSQAEIDVIISNGQDTLGDLAHKIVRQKNSGIAYGPDLKNDYYRLTLLDNYLRMVIDDDTEGIPAYLLLPENDVKLNKLLDAIYKLSDIFDVPGVPITGRRRPPLIFAGIGQQGTPGVPGTPGSNATNVVASDPDYDNMAVRSEVVGLTTTYLIGYSPYTLPQGFVAIQGSKVIQIGVVIPSLTIIVGSIRGRQPITRREIVSPGGITLLNPGINNPGLQNENVLQSNVSTNKTYTMEVEDDKPNIVTVSDSIVFVYPFLHGATPTSSPSHYVDLTKLIATKSTKQIVLNGVNKFFWFGYDASYGTLLRIKDQNGFDVTAEWTSSLINVSSSGLDNNWSNISFRFYRTNVATTINNGTYTFEFV